MPTFELLTPHFPREAPTLVICGEQDPIASRADQEKLTRAIANARLTIFPQLAHLLYWEDPANVAKEISSFVKNAETPRPDV